MIEYAQDGSVLPGDRLLRRVVALVAMTYGGVGLARTVLHLGLAKGWLASPRTMGWELGSGAWSVSLFAARTAIDLGWVLAGLLMLRGRRLGVPLLRLCAASAVALTAAGMATSLYTIPTYRSYFSTPAAAAMSAMDFLNGLWVPGVLSLLTLPALARRIV